MQRLDSSGSKFKLTLLFLCLFFSSTIGQIPPVKHHFHPTADSNVVNPGILKILKTYVHQPVTQPVTVKLSSDRNPVQVGEQVKLTAVLNGNINGAVYQFYNENGVLISGSNNNQCFYRFMNSGAHLVLVSVTGAPVYIANVPAQAKVIDTLRIQVDSVYLKVNPVIVETDKPVFFETGFNPEPGIVFRFAFGDDTYSDWSPKPSVEHPYSSPGLFYASAEIGRFIDQVVRPVTKSISKQVNVILPPPPPPPDTPFIPYVKLSADRSEVKTGEVITFAAITNMKGEGLRYMFDFRDNYQSESDSPSVQHIFRNAGRYNVTVRLIQDGNYPAASDSVVVFINPSLREYVTLQADRHNAVVGDTINFFAETNSRRKGLQYMFNTGIQGMPPAAGQNNFGYVYKNPGSYKVFVNLMSNKNIIAASEVINITVTPPSPSPVPLWVYAAALLLLSGAGYTVRKLFFVPKVTFHPHADPGKIHIRNEKELNIDFEIDFVADINSTGYNLSNDPVKEIKYE